MARRVTFVAAVCGRGSVPETGVLLLFADGCAPLHSAYPFSFLLRLGPYVSPLPPVKIPSFFLTPLLPDVLSAFL